MRGDVYMSFVIAANSLVEIYVIEEMKEKLFAVTFCVGLMSRVALNRWGKTLASLHYYGSRQNCC